MKNRVDIMGFLVNPLTMEETVSRIKKVISEKGICQHTVINAGKVILAYKDEKLKSIINECDIINADGQAIIWAAKFLGKPIPERVTGIDLMERLVNEANKEGYRVYFFGAKEEVVKKVIKIYKRKYPNLQVAGYRNGYFSEKDNKKIVYNIAKSNADILFIGFSSPQKEYWLKQHINEINIPFCMGVGGSFDVISGNIRRAPLWMQKGGLEWLFRFLQEPKRMWKRYFIGNIKFLYYLIKFKIYGI